MEILMKDTKTTIPKRKKKRASLLEDCPGALCGAGWSAKDGEQYVLLLLMMADGQQRVQSVPLGRGNGLAFMGQRERWLA
jgi:hypothetical protein